MGFYTEVRNEINLLVAKIAADCAGEILESSLSTVEKSIMIKSLLERSKAVLTESQSRVAAIAFLEECEVSCMSIN